MLTEQTTPPPDGRAGIDAALVRGLIADQFPQWRDLPVDPVPVDGHDNRTYRLGETMTVRLPTDEAYAAAVAKENEWLPVLAARLPVPVPVPLGLGAPGRGYPHPWSIRRWIDGDLARPESIPDPTAFAEDVAAFITALRGVPADGGPAAGAHSFHRGADPAYYDEETRRAVAALGGAVDGPAALEVWDAALAAAWTGEPVWFHGDLAPNNLLVRDGRLAAVIDFGTSGVGDPACDLVIAWTFFGDRSAEAFARGVDADAAAWARARGWAIWKALIVAADEDDPVEFAAQRDLVGRIIHDHRVHG